MSPRARLLRWVVIATLAQAAALSAVQVVALRSAPPPMAIALQRQVEAVAQALPQQPDARAAALRSASASLGYALEFEGAVVRPRPWELRARVPAGGYLRARLRDAPSATALWGSVAAVLALCCAFAVAITRRVLGPLGALAGAMDRFGAGDLAARAGASRDDEIGALARRFDDMAEQIAATVHAKDELLGAVAHELRTPLARLHVALDLLAEASTPDPALLASTADDLRELEQVVDDVLRLARARAEPYREAHEDVALEGLLHEEVARVRTQLACAVEVTATHADARCVAPPRLLRHALRNVLVNAATHGASPEPVRVSLTREGAHAVVTVEDRGAGMDAAARARAFEPFFRADASRTRSTGGVGLGLSLARRFLAACGGTIALRSEPGRGTVVRIALPLRTP